MAACSDYFRAVFTHDMIESKADSLSLPGISRTGFEPLIDYAYTGKLKLNLDTVEDVLSASSFLQVCL